MRKLVIFDNDGTICDTQEVEGRCYALAIERVTGLTSSTVDWISYDKPTSSAIVRLLLAGDADASEKEQ
jgi:phosphoglycolate phosphatase-like HAD superfamily hydrolase